MLFMDIYYIVVAGRHFIAACTKVTEFTGFPIQVIGGMTIYVHYTIHMAMLWAYSSTHFPTFGNLDRQIHYIFTVFSSLQRLVDLTFRRLCVFLGYMHVMTHYTFTSSDHIFGHPFFTIIHVLNHISVCKIGA